jgi:hypothetical protein
MMRRFACAGLGVVQWGLVGGVALSLGGCFTFGGREKAPKPNIVGFPKANASDGTPREPRLIGRVAMVNEEGHFVLVQCDAWKTPQEGTALKALRNGAETGILNVTTERRGAYVTADIVTGTPGRGDQVFQ